MASMNNLRILLMCSSEIQSAVATASLRVAPIGLFLINGYLRSKGHTTKIMQIKISQFFESPQYRDNLCKTIKEFDPDYIGYSFRNLFHQGIVKDPRKLIHYFSVYFEKPVVELLRKTTSAPIIGGGAGFSLAPRFYMHYLDLEYGVVGEGEIVFENLITLLEKGHDISKIPGLVFRRNGELRKNPHEYIKDLHSLPSMETGDIEGYRELYYDQGGYANIQTKRGCMFRCIYCLYPYFEGKRYRLRNIKTIVDEVLALKKQYDIRHFFIVDSVFSTPWEHSVDFCEELIRKKAHIQWHAYVNPRDISESSLKTYKDSGCHNLILTPDALSKKVLKRYQKDFSVDDVKRCIDALYQVDIPFEVSLILGGPGEDEETVNQTIAFCDEYLKDIPVLFMPGMWIHPHAIALQGLTLEELLLYSDGTTLDEIILSNDFEKNHILTYFFPHIKRNRRKILNNMFTRIRKHKRIVIGMDSVLDKTTGVIKHVPELGIIENQRPWHKGMRGRQ
jgi:radical SAM superfamily enzyme YgiQ (UPF0313 family)